MFTPHFSSERLFTVLNFQQQQESARKRTRWLVAAFLTLAVVVAVLATPVLFALFVVVIAFVTGVAESDGKQRSSHLARILSDSEVWSLGTASSQTAATLAGITILVLILGAAMWKLATLRAGRNVAEMLGGRRVQPNTPDFMEKRLLNVVEEMAIASGVPPPPVYILETEAGVNAFAAGYRPSDAVLAFTRGSLMALNREQLQGVVAHEFSHVFNGDMRLNLRLLAMLHGLLAVKVLGAVLARVAMEGIDATRGGSSRDRAGIVLLLLLVALLASMLAIIGFIGHIAGSILRAMVSRQREFLADASAVQFTRNPDGIGGALRVIGGLSYGRNDAGKLKDPQASEVTHMCFVPGSSSWLDKATSTHPPIDARIRRIHPQWDGSWLAPAAEFAAGKSAPIHRPASADLSMSEIGQLVADARPSSTTYLTSEVTITSVEHALPELSDGGLSIGHVLQRAAQAADLIHTLPYDINRAAHDPHDARCLLLAVLLEHEKRRGMNAAGLEIIRSSLGEDAAALASKLSDGIDQLDPLTRLPLAQICLGTLAALSADQTADLRRTIEKIARADKRVDLFEWAVERLILITLSRRDGTTAARRFGRAYLVAHPAGAGGVMSAVAHLGAATAQDAQFAFDRGRKVLRGINITMAPAADCQGENLHRWLDEIAKVNRAGRIDLLRACAAAVGADGGVRVREVEFLRVLAASIDVPLGLPLHPGRASTTPT